MRTTHDILRMLDPVYTTTYILDACVRRWRNAKGHPWAFTFLRDAITIHRYRKCSARFLTLPSYPGELLVQCIWND